MNKPPLSGSFRHFRRILDLFSGPSRPIVALALAVAVCGLAYGGYLFLALSETQARLAATEARISAAEARSDAGTAFLRRTEQRLRDAETSLLDAIAAVERRQAATFSSISEQIALELDGMQAETARLASDLSLEAARSYEEFEAAARARVEALSEKVKANFSKEWEGLKLRETASVRELQQQVATLHRDSQGFKRAFNQQRDAILFIRTTYQVRFLPSGMVREFTGFGTGFFISPVGVGMTAQHVIYPWMFDKQVQALEEIGMAEVLRDSLRVTMWLADARVVDPDTDPPRYHEQGAYRMGMGDAEIRILYASKLDTTDEMVDSPIGTLRITMPKLGKSDLLVFQVMDFGRRFPALALDGAAGLVAPLDEVMVVGYPLSRLQDGRAIPQPSRGRVRRVSHDLLELDSPLHPGTSGGPILDKHGEVVGLASAFLESPIYAVAVRGDDMRAAWWHVKASIREEQQELKDIGCDPGAVDGIPGHRTWRARQCAKELLGSISRPFSSL